MPPSELTIVNFNGIPFRNIAGPFNEGENAILKCITSDGEFDLITICVHKMNH